MLAPLLFPAIAFSQGAPTVIINEFLPNYSDSLESEWIELYNNSSNSVNLMGWQIGDELSLKAISDTDMLLEPYGYLILAQDTESFLAYYDSFQGAIGEPNGWSVLNNTGDVIRLSNDMEEIVDSTVYDDGFDGNRSWERFISVSGESFWGPSYDESGSTPGLANAYFPKLDRVIDIAASPNPFSPDGDSFEDFTTISYAPPPDGSFDLYVYDIAGYRVKTLCESIISLPGDIEWDGRDDSGRRLGIGIYILFAHYSGDEILESKTTVVIAR